MVQQEHLDIWREALDEDAERMWIGIREDVAPPLRRSFTADFRRRPQWWLLAAAIAPVLAISLWNIQLSRQLADIREDFVIATLAVGSPPSRLETIRRLGGESLSADAVEALKRLVRASQDPNIQLAALDLLLDSHALSEDSEIQSLLEQIRHNSQFIEAAIRARSVRT